MPGVTDKFDLGVQNEIGQKLTVFCLKNALVIANTLFQQQREDSTRGHHQMVNTKIRLIIFFADFDARRDWGQEEKGTTKDDMVGWHH